MKGFGLRLRPIGALADLPRLADNPYVFPGNKPGSHLIGAQRPWKRMRTAAGLERLRIHDLRHAFASVAVSSGLALPIIGKLLRHTQDATTLRYAHLAADPVKAAAQDVAGRIAAAMKSGADAAPSSRSRVIDMAKPPKREGASVARNPDDSSVPNLVQSSLETKVLPAAFYRTERGNEPVRDWLKLELSKEDRVKIGTAIKRVEIEWPIGKPICAPLSDGLWEVRVNLPNRIARVIFFVHDDTMVLLHGFIKKTQKTPQDDLNLAGKRKRDVEKADDKGRT